MVYNPKFDRSYNGNFAVDNNFLSIKNGSEAYLIEDELNELQWIQNEQRAYAVRSIINSGFLYEKLNIDGNDNDIDESIYIVNSLEDGIQKSKLLFNIKNYIPVNINGYLLKLAGTYDKDVNGNFTTNNNILLNLPGAPTVSERIDLVYLEMWFEEINYDSNNVIKKYGGDLNTANGNFTKDGRLNVETSHRIQLKWDIKVVENQTSLTSVYPKNTAMNNLYKPAANIQDETFSRDKNLFVSKNNASNAVNGVYYAIPILLINRKPGITIVDYNELKDISPISKLLASVGSGLKLGDQGSISITEGENNVVEIKDKNNNYSDIKIKSIHLNSNNNIISDIVIGQAAFNSLNGFQIIHNCDTIDYKVVILPSEFSSGDIGEYWIESKTANSFIIKNTGTNSNTKFTWMLIKHSNPNFAFGNSTFNTTTGKTITHNLNLSNYKVVIIPNQTCTGNIGDYWISSKTVNSFTVKNTGVNNTTGFDWVLIKDNNEQIITGSSTFNSNSGVSVGHSAGTYNYGVLISPTNAVNGDIGEYWVESKTNSGFIVKNTGLNTTSQFDWILIKNVGNNKEIILNNIESDLQFVYDNGEFANIVVGNLTVRGSTTTINSETINLDDNIIILNSNVTGTPTENGGIEVARGSQLNASLVWDESGQYWKAGILNSEERIATINFGNDSAKGTATNKKTLYISIDKRKIYFDNGSWLPVGGQDTVDWSTIVNKPTTFTPTAHTHTKSQVTDFPTTVAGVDSAFHYDAIAPTGSTRLNYNGDFHATRVFNAVYNDYAEYFEKLNDDVEIGDIVILDENSNKFKKSTVEYDPLVIGVYSDSFAQCIGGTGDGNDEDNFIPIGLAGRVYVKVVGDIKKGDLIVSSSIPGVGKKSDQYIPGTVVGKALENHTGNSIDKIRVLIMNI